MHDQSCSLMLNAILTKYFDKHCSGLDTTCIFHCKHIFSCVVSVTVLDDGHGPGGGVCQRILFTQIQFLITLSPEDLGFRFATNSCIKYNIRSSLNNNSFTKEFAVKLCLWWC